MDAHNVHGLKCGKDYINSLPNVDKSNTKQTVSDKFGGKKVGGGVILECCQYPFHTPHNIRATNWEGLEMN
jgi:hypothetical protein